MVLKIWTDFSSFLSQCTRLTDRRTDSFLIARPRLHCMQRGKSGSCDALQLEGHPTSRQSFWDVFGQICTAYAHKLPFSASDQNSYIARPPRFNEFDFPPKSNNVMLRRCVTLLLTT